MLHRISLFILVFLTACTSTQVLVKPTRDSLPARVTFLPVEVETDLTREHLETVTRSAIASLRNRGYLVSESTAFVANQPSVVLAIETLRRDTVLAGHVNIITGRLRFQDAQGNILAENKHTESERGGLLFNSGQVLKGILSEINNQDDRSFDDWIERFTNRLARSLPEPDLAAEQQLTPPEIQNIRTSRAAQGQRVCFVGPADHLATLRVGSTTFPMREIASRSEYCVLLPLRLLTGENTNSAAVTLLSPFGLRATAAIDLQQTEVPCSNLSILASTIEEASLVRFQVLCGSQPMSCEHTGPCGEYAFRLYETQSDGAFKLIEEFDVAGASRQVAGPEVSAQQFRVFQVHSTEQFQKPVQLTFSSGGE